MLFLQFPPQFYIYRISRTGMNIPGAAYYFLAGRCIVEAFRFRTGKGMTVKI